MAVPKRRMSRANTHSRRSQWKAENPALQEVKIQRRSAASSASSREGCRARPDRHRPPLNHSIERGARTHCAGALRSCDALIRPARSPCSQCARRKFGTLLALLSTSSACPPSSACGGSACRRCSGEPESHTRSAICSGVIGCSSVFADFESASARAVFAHSSQIATTRMSSFCHSSSNASGQAGDVELGGRVRRDLRLTVDRRGRGDVY